MRAFFVEFQDRILFGSDLGVDPSGLTLGSGDGTPGTRDAARVFFERHFRYFETEQRAMAHPTPIQGNWTIDGIGLPPSVLEKVYYRNAVRIFGLEPPKK
jgi:predicted TIM-barrel fold metal-dependent hydrolase